MLRLPVALSLCALLLSAPFAPALRAQEVLDGIAAVVNKDVITFSQVRDLVGPREKAARDTMKGEALVEKIKEIRLMAVNDLINRQLILQEFKEMQKKGANIPPHVMDEQVETIVRESFGGDKAAFIRTLAAQGYTLERFRQMEEEKIIVQAMRGQKARSTVIISDEQIRRYYNQHAEEWTEQDQMKLRMIVMKKGTDGTGADNRLAMMEEIREKVLGGAAFQDLARMYSEDSSTQEQGGDWGWINRKTLNESLTKLAFGLKPGQVSKIADISGNYYLLYCEAKKQSVTKPLAEVRGEIEKRLIQEVRQREQDEWIAKLRKKAYIKIY